MGAVSGGSTELGGCVWISTADHEGIIVALVCMPGQWGALNVVGCSQFMGEAGEACHSESACTSKFASSVGNLTVSVKETNSSPILPLDSAADSGCRHPGVSNTQGGCSGNGNAQSGAH